MKIKSQLPAKLEKLCLETQDMGEHLKKENRYCLNLQTEQELNQNKIMTLINKFNIKHFYSMLNDGDAVAPKQKICKLKQIKNDFFQGTCEK